MLTVKLMLGLLIVLIMVVMLQGMRGLVLNLRGNRLVGLGWID